MSNWVLVIYETHPFVLCRCAPNHLRCSMRKGIPLLCVLAISCKETQQTSPTPEAKPTLVAPTPPAEPPRPTVAQQLQSATTTTAAVSLMRDLFDDTSGKLDPATALFAVWSADKMQWTELQALPETKHAMIMKDSEAERGKRLCSSGSVVEIAVDRSAGRPIYRGGLITPGGNVIRFDAVGSTGEIVERTPARFCGVVTGRDSYSNAGGGTTHAVHLVGMFDLPENKKG